MPPQPTSSRPPEGGPPRLGDPVRVETTKWGGLPHWRFLGRYLGEDEHGHWLGFPAGTRHARAANRLKDAYTFDSEVDSVTLVPHDDWWAATFHAPGIWCDRYVDITTPAVWREDRVELVDLDLDVIRMAPPGGPVRPGRDHHRSGATVLDDEDEFARHRVDLGYPADVITRAERAAATVLRFCRDQIAPFDQATVSRWLDRLRAIPKP